MIPGTNEVLVKSWHPLDGAVKWRNANGMCVLQLHHSSDPRKDNTWADEAAKRYPGGREGAGWRAEMDIDFDARLGGRVYPEFSIASHVYPNRALPNEWARFRAIDPGFQNPFACIWVAVDPDDNVWVYQEHYRRRMVIKDHSGIIKGMTGRADIQFTVIDPSAKGETLQAAGKSIIDQLSEYGIYCIPGTNDVHAGIHVVAGLIKVREDATPRLRVMEGCVETIRELMGYRYKDQSAVQAANRDPEEKPVKKDDHIADALRYLVMALPSETMRSYGMADPGYVAREPTVLEKGWKCIDRKRNAANEIDDCWDD